MTTGWFDDDPAGADDEDVGEWYEDDGPMVRPYAVTRGRTVGAGHNLDMLTVVATAHPAPRLRRTEPEYHEILRLCRSALSIAEVAAALRLPLAVTKILIGDLIAEGNLNFRAPLQQSSGHHDVRILRAVLDGIRRI